MGDPFFNKILHYAASSTQLFSTDRINIREIKQVLPKYTNVKCYTFKRGKSRDFEIFLLIRKIWKCFKRFHSQKNKLWHVVVFSTKSMIGTCFCNQFLLSTIKVLYLLVNCEIEKSKNRKNFIRRIVKLFSRKIYLFQVI